MNQQSQSLNLSSLYYQQHFLFVFKVRFLLRFFSMEVLKATHFWTLKEMQHTSFLMIQTMQLLL